MSAWDVQPQETHSDIPAYIIREVLRLCGRAIQDFELKARQETSFCKTSDLEQLRTSLHHCLYYLFKSLWLVKMNLSNGPGFY